MAETVAPPSAETGDIEAVVSVIGNVLDDAFEATAVYDLAMIVLTPRPGRPTPWRSRWETTAAVWIIRCWPTAVLPRPSAGDQRALDALFRTRARPSAWIEGLPKGPTAPTLAQVAAAALAYEATFSTEALIDDTGLSRVLIHKYLRYLVSQ